MIDHDYYSMHILLSESTYFVLIQGMHHFGVYQDVKGKKQLILIALSIEFSQL